MGDLAWDRHPAQEQVHHRSGELAKIIVPARENEGSDHLVEGAEERLGRDLAGQVGAEDPRALALLDDAVEELQIVLQPGGGEPLHELRGLPQLHLEDHREVAVLPQGAEVMLGDSEQARRGPRGRLELGPRHLQVDGHDLVEEAHQDVFLVAEV